MRFKALAIKLSTLKLSILKLSILKPSIIACGIFYFFCTTPANATNYPSDFNIFPPDQTIKSQDNFYRYINGLWSSATPIPDNRPWNGTYVEQFDRIQARLNILVDKAVNNTHPNADDKNISALHKSIVDQSQREKLGIKSLSEELNIISQTRTAKKIAQVFARFNRQYHSLITGDTMADLTPFSISIWPDDKNARQWSVVMSASGLSLPSASYYLNDEPRFKAIRINYQKHIQHILQLAKINNAAQQAETIINLETELARCQKPEQETQSLALGYHSLSMSDIKKLAPAFDWRSYWVEAKIKTTQKIILKDTHYLTCINHLFVDPSTRWQDYLTWQLLRHHSPYLNKAFVDANFNFYSHQLLGNQSPDNINQQAITFIDFWLPDLLGRRYLENYFSESARKNVEAMTFAIRDAYVARIEKSNWLSLSAKTEAIRKLHQLKIKIGYPTDWPNKGNLELQSKDLIMNLRKITESNYQWQISQLGKPVDRNIWFDSVQSYNAYYNATTNDIVIPAGKIQAPLFDERMPDAYNFGGIGQVIAHEMGHALDDQGSQYDADGNLRNWWSNEDLNRFHERSARLVTQYNQYAPLPNQFVNGQKTLSENIADLTGLVMAYAALERTKTTLTQKDKDLFFTAWATRWRANIREPLMLRILAADTHAPAEYRCNGPLQNFEVFYDYANLKSGDLLYLPPEQRVSIW